MRVRVSWARPITNDALSGGAVAGGSRLKAANTGSALPVKGREDPDRGPALLHS